VQIKMSSDEEIVRKINNIFDRQIYRDSRFKVHKELFNLTLDFTLHDWNIIRTEKYWQTIDKLLDDDMKKEYTLKCVKYYLKNIKK